MGVSARLITRLLRDPYVRWWVRTSRPPHAEFPCARIGRSGEAVDGCPLLCALSGRDHICRLMADCRMALAEEKRTAAL